jgi:uncharacterized protein (DUF58 family)
MALKDYRQLKQSKIQLYSRLKLKNIFSGEWESVYTGEGIEFADIKPFEPGDDLRDLDILTLVQSGEEEIIRRMVGRQMRIYIWVDLSGSMRRYEDMFFSSKPDIRDIVISLILYSACNIYCPTGLCIFDNEIRSFLPAKYGQNYCDSILSIILDHDYINNSLPVDIPKALSFLMQKVYKQSMVFFISDFKDQFFENNFTDILRPIVKKVDFIPVIIRDPLETNIPIRRAITVSVEDNEGNNKEDIYLTPQKFEEIQEVSAKHLSHLKWNFKLMNIDHIVFDSPSINRCYQVLFNYFEIRHKMKG